MTILKKYWVKITQWEYWPFDVLYFPVKIYFVWLALKNRSFFFFTSANPSIDFGGMLGENKSEIYKLIPPNYLPKMALIDAGNIEKAKVEALKIGYPLIAKPDIGERGNLVEKIENEKQLGLYTDHSPVDFLLQELIDYPVELGVFYVREPNSKSGKVTSIVQKEFLSVIGDGISSIRELLVLSTRASLQIDFEHARFAKLMQIVPEKDEKITVEGIGNHCRGTIFLDKNKEIDDRLHQAIDRLSKQINGFYFGRFDLRCASFDDLRELKNFKILELNGTGAEPAHIYQPGYSLFKGYQSLFWHFSMLSKISAQNRKNGHPHWPLKRGLAKLREIKNYNKLVKKS
jgi:hypothetical protein